MREQFDLQTRPIEGFTWLLSCQISNRFRSSGIVGSVRSTILDVGHDIEKRSVVHINAVPVYSFAFFRTETCWKNKAQVKITPTENSENVVQRLLYKCLEAASFFFVTFSVRPGWKGRAAQTPR